MLKIIAIVFPVLLAFCSVQNAEKKISATVLPVNATVIDGPYVLYRNDSAFVKYIEDSNGIKTVRTDSMAAGMKGGLNLLVNTDEPGKQFSVTLKSKHTIEKSEWGPARQMLVISDIEGNFAALRKLLQGNGVINENFDWTFQKGHLVFVGDFVDRGNMVMEVLWLIYSLEEKAKAAGGHVHYILGNHEIMNMMGELKYVNERYLEHAGMMNKHYMHLFGPDSEIGRWLSTKNVVERIGNILFTHGGISSYVNILQMPLKDLNDLSRPFYTDSTYKFPDKRLDILFSDFGPFWYRGYYTGHQLATVQQIDSTLYFYGVRHITTGHTVVSTAIRTLFDGKLINTDVHHASGHSEALLIENGNFSRVNAAGEKFKVSPL